MKSSSPAALILLALISDKYCKEQGNAVRTRTVPKKPIYIQQQYKSDFIHNIYKINQSDQNRKNALISSKR